MKKLKLKWYTKFIGKLCVGVDNNEYKNTLLLYKYKQQTNIKMFYTI